MALTDILDQIKKDTEEKMKTLKKEHADKLKGIDEEFEKKEKDSSKEMDEQVAENSKKILNKMKTHAKMEAKNKLLKEKRELMDSIFKEALKQLVNSDNYKDMLVSLLKHTGLKGDDVKVCPAKGKEEETKSAIEASGKEYKLCDCSADIKGGFILKSEKIEIDNSFESILNKQLKDDLELEVAKTLFE
ncbi:V-type ATP synthase subunit E [Patescibacteria group bacterium]